MLRLKILTLLMRLFQREDVESESDLAALLTTAKSAASETSSASKAATVKSWESNKGQDERQFDPERVKLFHARNAGEANRAMNRKSEPERESLVDDDSDSPSPNHFHDSLSEKRMTQQQMEMESVTLNEEEDGVALDSLQHPKKRNDSRRSTPKIHLQPDSLSFEDDAFNRASLEFFDSISSSENKHGKRRQTASNKKLIIPYLPDSYSSNTSLFTSQEDEDEEDSIDNAARTVDEDESLEAAPRRPQTTQNINNNGIANSTFVRRLPNYGETITRTHLVKAQQQQLQHQQPRPASANPMTAKQQTLRPQNRLLPTTPATALTPTPMNLGGSHPDLSRARRNSPMEKRFSPIERQFPPMGGMRPANYHRNLQLSKATKASAASTVTTTSTGEPTAASESASVAVSLSERANNQSLVRMATERMKKKFLGWN